MRSLKPKITRRFNPGGTISFCVDAGLVDGKRQRQFFANKKAARAHARKMLTARKSQGALAFTLTSRQQIEAAKAFRDLEPSNATLTEAIAYFLRHAQPKGGTRTVEELKDEFLQSKTKTGKKRRYIKDLRYKLQNFCKEFSGQRVNEISRAKIEAWLDSKTLAPLTKRNYLRDIGMVLKFATVRGYCAENVVEQIEKPTLVETETGILTLTQAMSLLFAAHLAKGRELVPYIAIGLFAGLRSSELELLNWREINLHERRIEVKAASSKTGRYRYVEIRDNLAAWLEPHEKDEGRIISGDLRGRFHKLLDHAEIEKWLPNALRHSFGSYHFAQGQNANKTACEMGHESTKMLYKHYRKPIPKEEAEAFWHILPPQKFYMVPPQVNMQNQAKKKKVKSHDAQKLLVKEMVKMMREELAKTQKAAA